MISIGDHQEVWLITSHPVAFTRLNGGKLFWDDGNVTTTLSKFHWSLQLDPIGIQKEMNILKLLAHHGKKRAVAKDMKLLQNQQF